MSQPIMKLLGVALFAGIVFVRAGAANAYEITQGIPNTNETACVDVQGDQTTLYTPIEAYPCNGGFNEQWSNVGDELQGLGTSASGANCADPTPDQQDDTYLLVLDVCASPPPNTWMFAPPGQVMNFAAGDGECLDSQSEYGSGSQLVFNACNNASSQSWVVRDIVIEQMMPGTNEHACADVQDQAIKNDTPVNAYPCNLGINERWTWTNGQLRGIGTSSSDTTCLGAKEKKGTWLVVLQTCDANNGTQQWGWFQGDDSSGNYGVQFFDSQGCLDSKGQYGNAQLVVNPSCPYTGPTSMLWTMR